MSGHNQKRHKHGKPFKDVVAPKEAEPQEAVDENSPITQMFRGFRTELDYRHDKHERIVKLSRDITIESKRTIFLLHRYKGGEDSADVFRQAEEKLTAVERTKFRDIALELQNTDPYQFIRAYTAGLQEYIEALTFYFYLKDRSLLTLQQVQQRLTFDYDPSKEAGNPLAESPVTTSKLDTTPDQTDIEKVTPDKNETGPVINSKDQTLDCDKVSSPRTIKVPVPPEDYILGIADLSGELMRHAINMVGSGDLENPFQICTFLQEMEQGYSVLSNSNREVNQKLRTLRQSMRKVEMACYTLQVRGSEIPKHMLVDMVSKAAVSEYIEDQAAVT